MIRNKIDSDIKSLNELNKKYSWLPNENMIRPSSQDIANKKILISKINTEWLSTKDYILNSVFGLNYIDENGIKFVKDTKNINEWIFEPSIFRYNLEEGSNHYILWNSKYRFQDEIDNDIINNIITCELIKIIGSSDFDFAWYKNPKPTVPEFYHLQVFWR
jgi:hypothetical protein